MRAPFLSPASRPTSSLWSPPSYPTLSGMPSPQTGQHLTSQYPPSLTYLQSSSNPYLVPRKARAQLAEERRLSLGRERGGRPDRWKRGAGEWRRRVHGERDGLHRELLGPEECGGAVRRSGLGECDVQRGVIAQDLRAR